MVKISFPTTLEKFIAYQEELSGKPLDKNLQEVTRVYLRGLNGIYKEAAAGGTELFDRCVQMVDRVLAEGSETEPVCNFLRAYKYWCIEAREQGKAVQT